jgi:subtilisin family serine protease
MTAASLLAPSGRAGAQPAALSLTRHLEPRVRPHPLADDAGRVSVLAPVPKGARAADLGMLEVAPGMASIRLTPAELEGFAAANPGLPLYTGPGTRPQLDLLNAWTGVLDFREATGGTGTGEGVAVGVVDTGVDITHPGFQTAGGKTRIAWLFTWGSPKGVHPELEQAYGCTDPKQSPCAVYSAADIDAMLANDRMIPDDVHDRVGHGTHIASIAAGNGRSGYDDKTKFAGVAPGATLIVASPSRGGGFGDAETIRATRFIFDRAAEMGLPAVVNLSLGGDFGPHDGTAPLEQGIAAFVGDDKPGRAVVVAAGNSGSLFTLQDLEPLGVHTEVHVEHHAPARVPIIVPGATKGDVYVFASYLPEDEVSIGLEGPDGVWISPVARTEDAGYDDGEGTTAGIVNDQPGASSMTEDTNGAVVVWSGAWEAGGEFAILVEGEGDVGLWVSAQGDAARSGAYFTQALKRGTINTPASHPRLLAVGCLLNRTRWKPFVGPVLELDGFGPDDEALPDSLCYFSAGGPGPTGAHKPELVAPGAFISAAMSADADPRSFDDTMFEGGDSCPEGQACYVVDDRYALASGTSMSAPMVAGAAALMFQRDPNLTQAQVTEILQASARKPSGRITPESQIGAGALDLRSALAVLAAEAPSGEPPDVAASYWVLSAESARPDPAWLVHGTVQLRRADATVATGLDGGLLAVEVEGGGRLARRIAKVRHGTFSFAVAGRRGAGGSEMKVRVTYDGALIGEEKTLAVSVDPWARGPFSADGGCDCGLAPGAPARSWGALAVLAAAALARRPIRRRSRGRPR